LEREPRGSVVGCDDPEIVAVVRDRLVEQCRAESREPCWVRAVEDDVMQTSAHFFVVSANDRSCGDPTVNAEPHLGTKELIALTVGHRESAGSWADLLRDAKRRGIRAPVLAMGDGALRFWGALREVFPTTREQRCWFHRIANVFAALPKSAHPGAKEALAEICSAEDGEHAEAAVKAFQDAYGAKFPKAVAQIVDDSEELLAFYDFPAGSGCTCAPPTRSSQPSRPCVTGPRSPRDSSKARWHRDGVQADRGRPTPLARRQRTTLGRPRQRRREVRTRQTHRT